MSEFNFDSILDPEAEFYKVSYDDALQKAEEHTKLDGKQFGIQTGFQRFVLIGALKRLNEILLRVAKNGNNTSNLKNEKFDKILKSLIEIEKNILNFYSTDNNLINSSNSIEDVEFYEKSIKLIRSKIKYIYLQLGYKKLYPEIENSCNLISGDIPSTQLINNEQDMW